MNNSIQLTTSISSLKNSRPRLSLPRGVLFIGLALAWFGLSPIAPAVTPAPDGGYPGENTAEGDDALFSLLSGQGNTDDTAIGFRALYSNTTGVSNTATGALALENNKFGSNNTATGVNALQNNTSGASNTATGSEALNSNIGGKENTATGVTALLNNISGNFNTATGNRALLSNTTGTNNTGDGQNALRSNTAGSFNSALGSNAGFNLTTGSNNIDIANRGVAGESNTIRIGKTGTQTATFIAGIDGASVAGATVVVNGSGQLGVAPSSERFKQDIQAIGDVSEVLLALHPVTFHYKPELDPKRIPQFGLVAEEVEKVDADLVARDDQGKAYTVRYEAVNAMLLNEFLKEHRQVDEQKVTITQIESIVANQAATITQLKSNLQQQDKDVQLTLKQQHKEIEALTATVKEQASQIQRVTDQFGVITPALQMVADNP